jgi:transcriptional regulator with XRE-family HTH domain
MSKEPIPSPGTPVGTVIRQLRKEREWTLEELSQRADISVSGLSQIETGAVKRLREANVKKLASAFGVSEEMLDPKRLANRVQAEAETLAQRQLVGAVLALDSSLAEEALAVLSELARRRKATPR